MANQTKMIIITSDENIIRQFSLHKTKNTHIIDLDNANQVTSIEKNDENKINLDLLAQLSELNSNNDQIYKRALDSPDHSRSKPAKARRKSTDITCTICGDRAIGFNFDVLSCASCKAFFRRNANQNPGKIRCLTGQGQCSVAHGARRRCPKCRLDRCFAMGMRKDFILSEEDKQRRRKCLEENRNSTSQRLSTSESTNSSSISNPLSNSESLSPTLDEIDCLLMDINKVDDNMVLHEDTDLNGIEEIYLETLSIKDWAIIQSIESSFLSAFEGPKENCDHGIDLSDRASALISWSELGNQVSLRFINFFRQIDEFENLHADDRFILIKYNLLPVFPISKCFYYKQTAACSNEGIEEAEKRRRFFMLCNASQNVCDIITNLILSLVQITDQDPMLLSLLLTVLIFTQGLSMSEDEPPLKDSLAVNRAQAHYTKILWHFLVNKWGEIEACRVLTQLLTIIFRIQTVAKKTREFFRVECMTSVTMDQIAPLMQTVMHIS